MFTFMIVDCLLTCAHVRASRYIGVDMGKGNYDFEAEVSRKSKVAFEWTFQCAAGRVRHDIVTPVAENAALRGVPAPECARKARTALVDLEHHATEAAAGAKARLQERLGCSDLAVTCNYIGIVGAGGVDINAARMQSSTAAFEWTIQAPECQWKEEVRARVRDCSNRPIPLPSCTVTHARLQGAARAANQAASDLFGFEIRCVYPAVLSYVLKRLFV